MHEFRAPNLSFAPFSTIPMPMTSINFTNNKANLTTTYSHNIDWIEGPNLIPVNKLTLFMVFLV